MSVACTIGMAELQHDGKCKNDYKSGAIVFTGGTGSERPLSDAQIKGLIVVDYSITGDLKKWEDNGCLSGISGSLEVMGWR